RCHRLLEQARATAMVAHAGEFERLRAGIEATRLAYRAWADAWAKQFSAFCKSHGFLPDPALQQRTIFDDIVKPIVADDGPTAYFVIDALRYEMAEELHKAFEDAVGTLTKLSARFAELPTVTEVGMNVLAPVARGGRLATGPVIDGFSSGFATGEFRVASPETRRRAMHDRVGGSTCPLLALDEVVGRDPASLKRSIGRARLVVVHSREIDVAGEAGVSLDEFDKAVRKIKAAWQLLREAGVRRFVVTSDHGFLLPMGPLAVLQPHGRRTDPHPRYAFAPVAAETTGEVAVRLADLGYDGAEGCVGRQQPAGATGAGGHGHAPRSGGPEHDAVWRPGRSQGRRRGHALHRGRRRYRDPDGDGVQCRRDHRTGPPGGRGRGRTGRDLRRSRGRLGRQRDQGRHRAAVRGVLPAHGAGGRPRARRSASPGRGSPSDARPARDAVRRHARSARPAGHDEAGR
ncbi:MAG: BREX-6 system phosphatase PglZ, partial [Planctomycetia bacterium]|nr:BREX-6 system phosphatase PglZ [Planctomycetia bacterium]